MISEFLREQQNKQRRKRLKNTGFSLIASNCNGGCICHDLGQRFNSPFVNLYLKPGDFLEYLENMEHYNSCELEFVKEEGSYCPIGVLDRKVTIYFDHYKTEEEAREKWEERKKRIDPDNLFIMFTDRDNCTLEDLERFDRLPYKNKVVFTHQPYEKIKSAFYICGFENMDSVGVCTEFVSRFSGKRHYDQFDFVSWLNGEGF